MFGLYVCTVAVWTPPIAPPNNCFFSLVSSFHEIQTFYLSALSDGKWGLFFLLFSILPMAAPPPQNLKILVPTLCVYVTALEFSNTVFCKPILILRLCVLTHYFITASTHQWKILFIASIFRSKSTFLHNNDKDDWGRDSLVMINCTGLCTCRDLWP